MGNRKERKRSKVATFLPFSLPNKLKTVFIPNLLSISTLSTSLIIVPTETEKNTIKKRERIEGEGLKGNIPKASAITVPAPIKQEENMCFLNRKGGTE